MHPSSPGPARSEQDDTGQPIQELLERSWGYKGIEYSGILRRHLSNLMCSYSWGPLDFPSLYYYSKLLPLLSPASYSISKKNFVLCHTGISMGSLKKEIIQFGPTAWTDI